MMNTREATLSEMCLHCCWLPPCSGFSRQQNDRGGLRHSDRQPPDNGLDRRPLIRKRQSGGFRSGSSSPVPASALLGQLVPRLQKLGGVPRITQSANCGHATAATSATVFGKLTTKTLFEGPRALGNQNEIQKRQIELSR